MKTHLRFKELPAKNFGSCEWCGDKVSRFYAVSDLNKSVAADFVCLGCVTPEAVEIRYHEDIYAE